MWVFLATDAMGFGGLLLVYAVLRVQATTWPDAGGRLDRTLAMGLTLVLLTSGATMTAGAAAARAGRRRRATRWLAVTVALGAAFLVGQGLEFRALATGRHLGLTADHAASLFYVIAGYHGLHVLAGIVLLGALTVKTARSAAAPPQAVQVASLYWQFVDAIWIVIFTVLYLLPTTPGAR
jgi:heme/copper-type cytochrome/quinol oxidase subunit 3